MAKQQAPQPDEVKVKQWQVMWDDVNKKFVKVDATERIQTYEKSEWEELTKPSKDLNQKSRLEYAGYRWEVIKEKEKKATPVDPPAGDPPQE